MAVGGGGNGRWLLLSNGTHSNKSLFQMSLQSGAKFGFQSVGFPGHALLDPGKKPRDSTLFDSVNVCAWPGSICISPGLQYTCGSCPPRWRFVFSS